MPANGQDKGFARIQARHTASVRCLQAPVSLISQFFLWKRHRRNRKGATPRNSPGNGLTLNLFLSFFFLLGFPRGCSLSLSLFSTLFLFLFDLLLSLFLSLSLFLFIYPSLSTSNCSHRPARKFVQLAWTLPQSQYPGKITRLRFHNCSKRAV